MDLNKVSPTNKNTVAVYLTDDELEKIDDFWHDNRFMSRSKAIHYLITHALKDLKGGRVEEEEK